MKTFQYIITDPIGLHARPAGLLAKEAKKYESTITVIKEGKACDATKLLMLMSLGIKCGNEITVEVSGPDEDMACAEIESFFKNNL